MPTISKCPKCLAQVSLPDGVPAELEVRCPLCQAEYPLSEALNAVPPMLIVVNPSLLPVSQPEAFAWEKMAVAAADSQEIASAQPVQEGEDGLIEVSEEAGDGLTLEEEHIVADGEVAEAAPPTAEAEQGEGKPAAEGEAKEFGGYFGDFGFAEEGAETDEGEEGDESGEIALREEDEPIDGAAFGMAAAAPAAEGAAPAEVAVQPKRRRRYKSSPIRSAVGLIGSGVVGLILGYYVLNFFGGEQFDFLKIRLPGVAHTAKYKYFNFSGATDQPATNKQDNKKPGKSNAVPPKKNEQPKPQNPADGEPTQPVTTEKPGDLEIGTLSGRTDDGEEGDGEEGDGSEEPGTGIFDGLVPPIDAPNGPDLPAGPDLPVGPGNTPDVTPGQTPGAGSGNTTEPTPVTPDTGNAPDTGTSPEKNPADTGTDTPATQTPPETKPETTTPPVVPEVKNEGETPAAEPKTPDTVPPTNPQPPAASLVGLKDAPVYTADDLTQSIKAVYEVFGCPECKSTGQGTQDGKTVPCPSCKGQPKREITPDVYARFCRVAEVATFAKGSADAPIDAQKTAAADLMAQVAALKGGDAVAKLAASQLAATGDAGGGVVLVGTAGKSNSKDGLFGLSVNPLDGGKLIVVLSDHALPAEQGQQIFVLGHVVNNPAEKLQGYAGNRPQVIWGGLTVKSN